MSHRLMITVATAALIAGAGFANAQGMGGREGGGAGGGAMQQGASPSAGAPTATPGREGASQTEPKGGAAKRSAQQGMKPEGQERNGAMKPEGREDPNRAEGRDDRNNGNVNKAEGQERNGAMKPEGREDRNRAEGRDNAAGAREDRTVGQAGASAKLTTEQRTRVTTVIRDQHISPVTNINFSISVGTRVPREVGFHPLPTEIVTIYPDWRGYEFFLVRDQIVVVDPRSLEIVAVLDA